MDQSLCQTSIGSFLAFQKCPFYISYHYHNCEVTWQCLCNFIWLVFYYKYLLLFSNFQAIPSMQQGSQLHIALLRKISQQLPTSNFRQRFNQSKKRRDFFRCNMTEQSNESENNQTLLPLFERNSNLTPVQKSSNKVASKKNIREQNITISAWSIDEKDQGELFQETRYNKKVKQMINNQTVQPKKKRIYSIRDNLSVKKVLPEIEYTRCPSYDYTSKAKTQKEIPARYKFNKIKHINLNLDKQNELNALEHMFLKEAKIRSVQKISSYNAFVAEMKQYERNKKLRS